MFENVTMVEVFAKGIGLVFFVVLGIAIAAGSSAGNLSKVKRVLL